MMDDSSEHSNSDPESVEVQVYDDMPPSSLSKADSNFNNLVLPPGQRFRWSRGQRDCAGMM